MRLHTTTTKDGREQWTISSVRRGANHNDVVYVVYYAHDGNRLVTATFLDKKMAASFFNWACGIKDAYIA